LYTVGDDRVTRLGTVLNMFYGVDTLDDEFIVLELENKPITARMGHCCTYSSNSRVNDLVLWNKITWKCKLIQTQNGVGGMALPFQSCTPKELMEFT
jgi:hypothetical protein